MRGISVVEMVFVAFVFGLIPLAFIVTGFLIYRVRSRERLLAIEKGAIATPTADDRNFRVGGMICLAVSVGLLITLAALDVPRGVLGVPAIPGLVGIALLFEYRARMREKGPTA
jgi:hypothetical protein